MSVSLTNSVDIVANSISIIGPDGQLISLTEAIEGGVSVVQGDLTPDQLQDLSSLSTALNNDPNYFTTVTNQLGQKADKATTYTKGDVDNLLLTNYDTKLGVNIKIATAINNLVDSAPDTLNTLNELAAALNDDTNFATTVTNQISLKADKTYTDTALNSKADKEFTYTKTEVDNNIGGLSLSTEQGLRLKADKTDVTAALEF